MKLPIPIPGKNAIALTVAGFALGGAAVYVALAPELPFMGSNAAHGAESETEADDHGKDAGNSHGSGHGKKPVAAKKSEHAKPASHGDAKKPVKAAKSHDDKAQTEAHAEEKTAGEMVVTSEHAPDGAAETKGEEHAHWSYEGKGSPENWAELSPQYASCGEGIEQTPIDLAGGIKSDVSPVFFNYKAQLLRISNNGHTIQVGSAPGSFMTIGGGRYELAQFHFHHPSEHLLDGKVFPLELHLVHKSSDGAIAVVGVFFRIGAANAQIDQIFSQMPRSKGPEASARGIIDPAAFLPKGSSFYRYMGSLTTPPCTEGLTWTVFKEPLEISQKQLDQFAALFPHNARPLQQRNRRFLLEASAK